MPGPASALRARLEDQLWLTPFRMAGAEDSAVLNKARRMHARGRGRALVLQRAGAEGATAPETLRQKDRRRKGALESGGPVVARPARSPKE